MNSFLGLLKVLFKTSTGFLNDKTKRKNNKYLIYLVYIMLGFIIISPTIKITSAIYDLLKLQGLEVYLLQFGFSATSIVIMLYSVFYVMGSFYFSQDIENYLYLPIKPYKLLTGKFIIALVNQYIMELLLLIPMVILFGVKGNFGFIYYLYSVIIFLLFPIVPLCFSSIISMIIMRFSSFSKRKDLFKLISGIISLLFAIGINMLVRESFKVETGANFIFNVIEEKNFFLNIILNIFTQTKLYAYTLTNSSDIHGLFGISGIIVSSLISISVFMILGEILYLKGVVGLNEINKTKKRKPQNINKNITTNTPIKSYVLMEIKTIIRTPQILIYGVLTSTIWSLYIVIYPIISDGNLSSITSWINNSKNMGVNLVLLIGITIFFLCTNPIFYTPISRDGRRFYLNKFIPFSYEDQIKSKIIVSSIMGLFNVFIYTIVLIILKLSFTFIVSYILTCIPVVIFISMHGLSADLNGPKLDWDNENEIFKNNFKGLIMSMINLVLVGSIYIVLSIASIFISINLFIGIAVIAVTYIILGNIMIDKILEDKIKLYEELH
ncbi:putative ABC transporter permease subunit [Tepidibacter hydrothermalis]|uniref:ABC-2 type transport system permease protein n=1 Tax=Tepidibacter hydrothermalis TaxID=3036126 RepID=A0ABY8EJ09_9FIRM|nr:hypothetical protein [Tepidibacter hydrothermalis]WFD10965.1 hypothetical protein P4S50_02510 [Tepidibacter hydrothermalis]